MAPLMSKKSFIKSGEGAIATYDYIDIANGVGIASFDAFATQASGAVITQGLISSEVSGDPIYTRIINTGGATTHNFDVAFNTPRTMKGKVVLNFTLGEIDDGGSCHVVITLYKGTNGVYTSLGTATCSQFAGTDTKTDYYRKSLGITVTETNFKIGDIFRVTAVLNVYYVTGNHSSLLYYDPSNETLTSTVTVPKTYNSNFKVYVPFRLDI